MALLRFMSVTSGCLALALGTGYVMQNGFASAASTHELQAAEIVSAAPAAPAVPAVSETPGIGVAVPKRFLESPRPDSPLRLASLGNGPGTVERADDKGAARARECVPGVAAKPLPGALVDLRVSAPCHRDTRLTVHHQGMSVSVMTDEMGRARLQLPALAKTAVFMVELASAPGLLAVTDVPDLADWDRVVLQWRGTDGLSLHALEFGAGYHGDGHVSAAALGDETSALTGMNGYLMRLGDMAGPEPRMAEIYSFPSGKHVRSGTVDLSVEVEVTVDNCGRPISAEMIQVAPGLPPTAIDLEVTLPGCDALGELLVLQNMAMDLKLASR